MDWGLGHATRIVPLVRAFESFGCRITIACSGATEHLLRGEFPRAGFIHLDGYGVTYPKRGGSFLWKILRQVPSILLSVSREHRWLERMQALHGWDAVVSDNRYGFYHASIPSVIVTHQLHIRTGIPLFLDGFVRFLLFRRLSRFDECWVPDSETEPSLSGALSHGRAPLHARYVGPLSRFNGIHRFGASDSGRLLILLSGPEPQRTLFEDLIEGQLSGLDREVLVVRGLPGGSSARTGYGRVRWINHLGAGELEEELRSASLVVARSGYSTVMDLARTGRRAVLVPTPGQTEQEYLARHLADAGWFLSFTQSGFDLRRAVAEGLAMPPPRIEADFELHREAVRAFLCGDHKRRR